MLDYFRVFSRVPEAAQDRPDTIAIERLEQFLGYVDEQIAAHERAALRLANDVIARAARKPEAPSR